MFIVYNLATKAIAINPSVYRVHYETEGAAKSALTKFVKRHKLEKSNYAVAEYFHFFMHIQKKGG